MNIDNLTREEEDEIADAVYPKIYSQYLILDNLYDGGLDLLCCRFGKNKLNIMKYLNNNKTFINCVNNINKFRIDEIIFINDLEKHLMNDLKILKYDDFFDLFYAIETPDNCIYYFNESIEKDFENRNAKFNKKDSNYWNCSDNNKVVGMSMLIFGVAF